MNKYQEVKETLEKYDYSTKLELSEGIRNNITSDITVEQFFMMKETCIELLDKATPKKPTILPAREFALFECPTCHDKSEIRIFAFCQKCGQALDWSKDE